MCPVVAEWSRKARLVSFVRSFVVVVVRLVRGGGFVVVSIVRLASSVAGFRSFGWLAAVVVVRLLFFGGSP